MENLKECKILGYGTFSEKETGEMMLRILIGVNSTSEKYVGLMVAPPVFLKYNEELEKDLKDYIEGNYEKAYYKTTDNIITGKTKVVSIIVE